MCIVLYTTIVFMQKNDVLMKTHAVTNLVHNSSEQVYIPLSRCSVGRIMPQCTLATTHCLVRQLGDREHPGTKYLSLHVLYGY